jgi:hypothetical protein
MHQVSRFVVGCPRLTHRACSRAFQFLGWRDAISADRNYCLRSGIAIYYGGGARAGERTFLEQGLTMRIRRSTHPMRVLASLAMLAATFIASAAEAQARCDEATVRRLAAVSVTELASPDLYFNVQTGVPSVVGLAQLEALKVKHANERKNERPHVFTILQVDATKDGSMAYDDGSVHVEFDDAKTGKHVAYDLSYLRVWKVVGGKCVTAAMYGRRGDEEHAR